MTEGDASARSRGIARFNALSSAALRRWQANGVGNTTTTTAVLCALLQRPVEELVGRGAGLDDAGLARKRRTIERGLARYDFSAFQDERERAFAILRTFGGLDIAGLVGVCLGGATFQVPIVLDGVISASSALVAETLVPGTRDYMIASHSGREKGIRLALERLGLVPYIDGQMALEGTGAMMLFPLLDASWIFTATRRALTTSKSRNIRGRQMIALVLGAPDSGKSRSLRSWLNMRKRSSDLRRDDDSFGDAGRERVGVIGSYEKARVRNDRTP